MEGEYENNEQIDTTDVSREPTLEATVEPSSESTVEPNSETTVEPTSEATAGLATEATGEPTSVATAEPSSPITLDPSSEVDNSPTDQDTSVEQLPQDTSTSEQLQGTEYSRKIDVQEDPLFETLRLNKEELADFLNPYEDKNISLESWKEDFKPLVRHTLINDSNVNVVIQKFLEDNVFVIIYEEGTKKHGEFLNILSELREPFVMISSKLLKRNDHCVDFCNEACISLSSAPFVLYDRNVYRNVEALENLLYRNTVPSIVSHRITDEDSNEFDLIVLGNTIGGLIAAQEASQYSSRVMLISCLDSISSVNVSCAKQIMRSVTKMFEMIRLGYKNGFRETSNTRLIWKDLMKVTYIKSKKEAFKTRLSLRGARFLQANAKFTKQGGLQVNDQDFVGKCYIIATESAPKFPSDIIGVKEHCISTDILLSSSCVPNDTLIIGDSNEGMEIAGFLNACEFKVTVLVCSGMHECPKLEAEFVKEIRHHMEARGVTFIEHCKIIRIKTGENKIKIVEGIYEDGTVFKESYNTVVIALGRMPRSNFLGLRNTQVKLGESRHIVVNQSDQTDQKNIYALGSVAEARPESAAAAMKSAKLLIDRLFNYGSDKMNYELTPQIILTPLEYASIGMTEKIAKQLVDLGKLTKVFVYENDVNWRNNNFPRFQTDAKILCNEDENGWKQVLGVHLLGNGVGETMQGLTALVEKKYTIKNFDKLSGSLYGPSLLGRLVLKKTISSEEERPVDMDMEKIDRLLSIMETKTAEKEPFQDENIIPSETMIISSEDETSFLSTEERKVSETSLFGRNCIKRVFEFFARSRDKEQEEKQSTDKSSSKGPSSGTAPPGEDTEVPFSEVTGDSTSRE